MVIAAWHNSRVRPSTSPAARRQRVDICGTGGRGMAATGALGGRDPGSSVAVVFDAAATC